MDLSPAIAWTVPLVGAIASAWLGLRAARGKRASYWGTAFGLAFAFGIGLTFFQVALHSGCIELRLCTYRGDHNMSYWFQSFFAIPLFWLAGGATWQVYSE